MTTYEDLPALASATRDALQAVEEGHDPDTAYRELESFYATFGLDANVAESSMDWLEGSPLLLKESLEDALRRRDETEGRPAKTEHVCVFRPRIHNGARHCQDPDCGMIQLALDLVLCATCGLPLSEEANGTMHHHEAVYEDDESEMDAGDLDPVSDADHEPTLT